MAQDVVMATAGDVLHNPITGERLTVLLGADDTDGRYLAATLELPPGERGVPGHAHPGLVEAFQVRRGTVRFRVGGEERTGGPGTRVVVPRGAHHHIVNVGDRDAELLLEVWPARRYEQFLATVIGLAREGSTDASGTPDPFQLAVLAREFAGEIRFGGVNGVLQGTVFTALAPVGRLLGRRPSYPRHAAPADRVAVAPWRERPAPAC